MSKLRFGAPLYLYFDQSRPDLGMAPVVDVDEGLHVIQRGPIARYRFASRSGGEREAWSTALYALTRAKSARAAGKAASGSSPVTAPESNWTAPCAPTATGPVAP